MSEICSYCYLVQRADRVEHAQLSREDLEMYVAHLREKHGVVLAHELTV